MSSLRRDTWLLAPAGVLVLLFLIGIAYLVVESLRLDSGWGLGNFSAFWARADYVRVLQRTLVVAVLTTLFSALIGYPIALAIARYRGNRNLLMMLVIMPWLVSVVVRTYGWLVVLGRKGTINSILMSLGLIDSPVPMVFNQTGVVIGLVHVCCPFLIISVLTVLLYQDRSLEEASQMLGAGPWHTFTRITWPLSLPGVITGMILVYLLSVGAIVTPLLLGGVRDSLLATQIYQDVLQVFDYPKASSMAIILLAVTFILVLPAMRLERHIANRISGEGRN